MCVPFCNYSRRQLSLEGEGAHACACVRASWKHTSHVQQYPRPPFSAQLVLWAGRCFVREAADSRISTALALSMMAMRG
jgi:hypothetical protein